MSGQNCRKIILSAQEERLVAMMKALGNPVRFEIVKFLNNHQGCITKEIVEHFPQAQSTISQHLKVLKECGIIQGEVEGPAMNYCLNNKALNWFKIMVEEMF